MATAEFENFVDFLGNLTSKDNFQRKEAE